MATDIAAILGKDHQDLLKFSRPKLSKKLLNLPGPGFVDRVLSLSDRSVAVRDSLKRLYGHGRLASSGYLSILPLDQGIEHSAGVSFAPNPAYFDPVNIVQLAIEGGCNAVASTYGVLAMVANEYAEQIPFIVKLNHNELLSYPNSYDQTLFASAQQAHQLGAAGVGATIYFGSPESRRQIREISKVFEEAHQLGMFTVLWCYVRHQEFKTSDGNFEVATDLTGQANHLGVTIGADIIKQKMPETNYGFRRLKFGKYSDAMYEDLMSDHPIDACRYQVMNCYAGRAGLINSGGASGDNDLQQAVMTAVVNKRAGGTGLITGRKAFMKPMKEGVKLLNAVQDVYLDEAVAVA
ncbi:MAG: fructose-bisphosphate aldolase [Candidatus Pacebacteria bacterium CG10_big_fil_rev_8_21_14_0_10_56_10]|nr:MAG: fructose-bisphosphate aldolase [Candidatus Pacebacteria bacterium CG10_big_fil_rev_8_21_14_0_10_56_10]